MSVATRQQRRRVLTLGLVGLLLLTSCWGSVKPDRKLMLGDIEDLVVPEHVVAGTTFDVTITTVGNGCTTSGGTEVKMDRNLATITVADYWALDTACPALVVRIPHTATLRFDQPGTAIVRIQGSRIRAETTLDGVPTTIERRIVVR